MIRMKFPQEHLNRNIVSECILDIVYVFVFMRNSSLFEVILFSLLFSIFNCRLHLNMRVLYTVFVSFGLCSSGSDRLRKLTTPSVHTHDLETPMGRSPMTGETFSQSTSGAIGTQLKLSNIPPGIKEEDLLKMFSPFGQIKLIRVCWLFFCIKNYVHSDSYLLEDW